MYKELYTRATFTITKVNKKTTVAGLKGLTVGDKIDVKMPIGVNSKYTTYVEVNGVKGVIITYLARVLSETYEVVETTNVTDIEAELLQEIEEYKDELKCEREHIKSLEDSMF